MRILVDENIPKLKGDYLNRAGHDVVDLPKSPQEGLSDEMVWALVRKHQRLLITTGKRFLKIEKTFERVKR